MPRDRSRTIPPGVNACDVSVLYLIREAKIGSTLRVSVTVNNLSNQDLTLDFPTSQQAKLEILDSAGDLLFGSPPGAPAPTKQPIPAGQPKSWQLTALLDAPPFAPGEIYIIRVSVLSKNYPAVVCVPLTVT
jgi:hypothetical protein